MPGAIHWEWKGMWASLEHREGSRWKLLGSEVERFLKKMGGLSDYYLKAEYLPGSRKSSGER